MERLSWLQSRLYSVACPLAQSITGCLPGCLLTTECNPSPQVSREFADKPYQRKSGNTVHTVSNDMQPETARAAARIDREADQSARVASELAALPSFVQRRDGGLFVNPKMLENSERFAQYVQRVIDDDCFFTRLDYTVFERLLYDPWPLKGANTPLRIAAEVRSFDPARRQIYKGFATSSDGRTAQYMFEPVYIDTVEGEDAARSKSEPAKLDLDEFIAHAWKNEIRFGIDGARVREAILKSERGRVLIATGREPKPGTDASIEEKCTSLHRDDSPTMLASGQLDLGQFKNRFPQAHANELLFRKKPRTPGEPGRKLSGEIIEQEFARDLDLATLAGPGTRIEERGADQYIAATITGYVDIDKTSHLISISENMVGREGVSMRTTGNLRLSGALYEEHGEVEERRVVEGKDMTFHANVYGDLISTGGVITIKQNLISGKVKNPKGQILARGRASASTMEAPGGIVKLAHAEGCVIWANRVEIEHAVCCEIIASELVAGNVEGCTIVAHCADIQGSGAYRGRESAITVVVPSQLESMEKRAEAQKRLEAIEVKIGEMNTGMENLAKQKEFGEFLKLQTGIARGEVRLSAESAAGFRQMHTRMAALNQQYRAYSVELASLQKEMTATKAILSSLKTVPTTTTQIGCAIASITGETIVQNLHDAPMESLMNRPSLLQIRAWLHNNNQAHQRLFSRDSGSFTWRHRREQSAPAPAVA